MINQELLSTDRTDLIDKFGVIQINLSNRGFRNQDLCYIFHKDARFNYSQNCRILQIHYLGQADYPSKKFATLNVMSVLKIQKVSAKFC